MENPLAQRIIDQTAALDSLRAVHEPYWDELGAICLPRGGTIQNQRTPGVGQHPDRDRIAANFDGTAQRSNLTLGLGQSSRITPMGSRWFVLRPPSALKTNQAALNWYAKCSDILMSDISLSNFHASSFQTYLERGAYGVSAIETTESKDKKGLHFRVIPIGSYSVAENENAHVDTVARSHFATPSHIVSMFGKDGTIPESVATLAGDPSTKHKQTEKVIHHISPRDDRDPRSSAPQDKPIASVHVHVSSATVMRESGFDSMPMAVSRWMSNPLSPYGWGPGDYALPEATQANFQSEMLDLLTELQAHPRILYPAGMKDEIDLGPNGLTSFDPSAGENAWPREWLTGGRYDVAKDRLADKTRAIESAFFVELFQAVLRLPAQATATQVGAIVNESRELFHPIFSNQTKEFLTPVLQRAFSIRIRAGAFPPPPSSVFLQDNIGPYIGEPEVEYVSSMAMALEATHSAATQEILATFAPLAQIDPGYLDNLNPDTIVPHIIRARGLPVEFLRTAEQLQALRAGRDQAAKAAAAQQASAAVRNLGGVDETARAAAMLQS